MLGCEYDVLYVKLLYFFKFCKCFSNVGVSRIEEIGIKFFMIDIIDECVDCKVMLILYW